MTIRKVMKTVKGQPTIDGAGVHLIRVIGPNDVKDFDPFLMLDSFDSENPDDYIKGFPMHPHRGIETITYLIEGEIEHQDSLGNKGVIGAGASQWMTAGSGIIHQEMPAPVPRLLGLQIWLNLPSDKKMTTPTYFNIEKEMVKIKEEPFGRVHVIAGGYDGTEGIKPLYHPATLYDVEVDAGKEAVLPTDPQENVFIFLIVGNAEINGEKYEEKTAVLFGQGDEIKIKAEDDAPTRFIYFAGKKLHEPVAWGGPIVMNTREELMDAFNELNDGTFIQEKPEDHHEE